MSAQSLIILDGVKWWDTVSTVNTRLIVPLCLQHDLRMQPVILYSSYYQGGRTQQRAKSSDESVELRCEEDAGHVLRLPRKYDTQKQYVMNKIDAQAFSKMPVLNLDDSAVPVAKEDIKEKNNPYWVRSKITESKAGTRLIIWAGNRDAKNKTQLFVEPEIKKLSFDQNDDHPLEVFAKVEVTFADGVKMNISQEEDPKSSKD
jgi:hypothetical protein